jgi:monoamine oxidase
MHPEERDERSNLRKVAVIGGGIAGLYTAWRILQDSSTPCRVAVYESLDRTGGRLLSKEIPDLPFRAELGAMRFRRNHHLLAGLIQAMELPVAEFNFPDPMYFLRGRRMSQHELIRGNCASCGGELPFRLRSNEQGRTPAALVLDVIERMVSDLNFPGLHQTRAQRLKRRLETTPLQQLPESAWMDIRNYGRIGDVPLSDLGFWNVLQHYLSNEAYSLVRDALSLESVMGNWNAAEAIPWYVADFSSDELFTIRAGFSELANVLAQRISSHPNGEVHLGAPVRRILHHNWTQSDHAWQLEFEDATDTHANAVVLAVGRSALEKMDIFLTAEGGLDHIPDRWKPRWLANVRSHRLFKIFLVYDSEWWMGDKLPGGDAGRVFTDLPLRQVFYLSPSWMKSHGVEDAGEQIKRPAMILASYSDEHFALFWEPVESSERKHFRVPSGYSNDLLSDDCLATERMVDKVHHQLCVLHGRDVPKPMFGFFADWGRMPFGGGWHTWEVSTQPWKNYRERTVISDGLYLCGEAYSREQGWIEGALKTAECVLHEFGCKQPPSWLRLPNGIDFSEYIGVAPIED